MVTCSVLSLSILLSARFHAIEDKVVPMWVAEELQKRLKARLTRVAGKSHCGLCLLLHPSLQSELRALGGNDTDDSELQQPHPSRVATTHVVVQEDSDGGEVWDARTPAAGNRMVEFTIDTTRGNRNLDDLDVDTPMHGMGSTNEDASAATRRLIEETIDNGMENL